MNTDFPLKAQDAIIGDVIIYPEMDMSRTDEQSLSHYSAQKLKRGRNIAPEHWKR